MQKSEDEPFLWRYIESTLKTDMHIQKIYSTSEKTQICLPGRRSTKNEHRNAQVEFVRIGREPRTKNEHGNAQVEFVCQPRTKNEHGNAQVEFIRN